MQQRLSFRTTLYFWDLQKLEAISGQSKSLLSLGRRAIRRTSVADINSPRGSPKRADKSQAAEQKARSCPNRFKIKLQFFPVLVRLFQNWKF